MGKELLAKIRRMNWLFQESGTGKTSFNDLCAVLSDLLDSNVYITTRKGKILGVYYKIKEDTSVVENPVTGEVEMEHEYNDALMKLTDTAVNLSNEDIIGMFDSEYLQKGKYHTFVPIIGGGERWGTLSLARYSPAYTDEDIVLAEYGAAVLGLEIRRQKQHEHEDELREITAVKMAMGTLSYSEIEAVHQIFAELEGDEGLLVASKIADRSGITRSVIVNALRKLESAGIIESRSLGMKGTHIKIINKNLKDYLATSGF